MRIQRTLLALFVTFVCFLKDIYTVGQPSAPFLSSDQLDDAQSTETVSHTQDRRDVVIEDETKSNPILVDRRQLEELPRYLPQRISGLRGSDSRGDPTCTELRSMWRQLKRMTRHSQLTNEIPKVLPGDDANILNKISSWVSPDTSGSSRFRSKHRNNPKKYKSKYFGGRRRSKNKQKNKPKLGFGRMFAGGRMSGISKDNLRKGRWNSARNDKYGMEAVEDEYMRGYGQRAKNRQPYYGTFVDIPVPEDRLGAYGKMVFSPLDRLRHSYRNGASPPRYRARDIYRRPAPISFSPEYRLRELLSRGDRGSMMTPRLSRRPISRYVPQIRLDDRRVDQLGFGGFMGDGRGCTGAGCPRLIKTPSGRIIDDFGMWHENPIVISPANSDSK